MKTKGQFGNIRKRRGKILKLVLLSTAGTALLLLAGYYHTHTLTNLMTLLALSAYIPALILAIRGISLFFHKGLSEELFRELEEKGKLLEKCYDLMIAVNGKTVSVGAIVVYETLLCGYLTEQKERTTETENFVKEFLKQSGHTNLTVRFFGDRAPFLSRVEGMNAMADVAKATRERQEVYRQLIQSVTDMSM